MIRTIQDLLKITATLVVGSLILVNCEPDADQLGSQFFENGAQGTEASYPIIAYNISNNDSIRTDAARLQSATLGVFTESQFGMQKSDYVTQIRLPGGNPDFGVNAKLDSAVLVIKPQYAMDSITTVTNEDYIYPQGAVPAKKVVSSYPIIKYGNTKILGKTLLNLRVHEVTDFLGSNADKVFSDRSVNVGAQIGAKTFDGNVHLVKVTKDADNSALFERLPAIRIPLDSTFMANKIINKASSPELSDAASFIRYFKGIKVSVVENDGYLFNFDPSTIEIILYYKNDKLINGVTTREQSVYTLNSGSANAHFNKITFKRAGTPSAVTVKDSISGSPRVYAQGMGGPGFGLKVTEATIAAVKALYQSNKIGIVSAKLRIYTDATVWNNKYSKPTSFVVREKVNKVDLNSYLEDMSALYGTGIYKLVKAFDLEKNPAYYEIGITQTFKNIIEKGKPKSGHFVLNVGDYTTDSGGNLQGSLFPTAGPQNFNTRSFTPNRVVLVGTDLGNEKSAKLVLTYGTK